MLDQFDVAQLAGEQFVPICITPNVQEDATEELTETVPTEEVIVTE